MGSVLLSGIVFTVVLRESFPVSAACPRRAADAEVRAKDCLTSVGLVMDPTAGGNHSGGPDRVKQYCQDGTLQRALACVEDILMDCQRENAAVGNLLSKSINMHKLRNGYIGLCEDIDILSQNRRCVEMQAKPISQCVRVETANFQVEIQNQRNGRSKIDDVWELSCRFMDRVLRCQDDSFRKNCSEPVANVLSKFMQSVRPPVCADYVRSGSIFPSGEVLVCLLSVIIYLGLNSHM